MRVLMPRQYLQRILNSRVYDLAIETPLGRMGIVSTRLGNNVFLKREDLQPVFSFKLRGAYNRIYHLGDSEKKKGVIAASAGNHAQGVALAGNHLGVKAVIVMPITTPSIKVNSVRALAARIVLHGDTYDEACSHALALAKKHGYTFIHPYDDPLVIAGQGTVGMEILRQHPDPIHAVFVSVGGGGLIAGLGAFIKTLRPDVRLIGVEPEDAASMTRSLEAGRRVRLDQVGIFADGVAVRQVGKETFRLARQLVDEMILVDTDEICAAIKDIYDDTRSVAEPAGAVALAGLKKYVQEQGTAGRNLIAVNSGANINFDRLRHVAERAELGEDREALFAVTLPEEAGSFRAFCRAIGRRSITEFNYRYADARQAQVLVGVALTEGARERLRIVADLKAKGYSLVDLSENEMAILHLRHMVGGHAPHVSDERVFRFVFPERPGALLNFLNRMGEGWNISLFHYRNHGSAFGRVLVGVQVPKDDNKRLKSFLKEMDDIGYPHCEETENPVYRLFLG